MPGPMWVSLQFLSPLAKRLRERGRYQSPGISNEEQFRIRRLRQCTVRFFDHGVDIRWFSPDWQIIWETPHRPT